MRYSIFGILGLILVVILVAALLENIAIGGIGGLLLLVLLIALLLGYIG